MIADPNSNMQADAPPHATLGVDVRDAARNYINAGYAVVPVPHRTKRALEPGWPTLRIDPEDVDSHFRPVSNIGIILGEPSGHLVDIDLDCEEAITLAPHFLPPTPVRTGRASKPNSHFWYRCTGAKYAKLTDPETNESIVEIRGTGHQTVVGPSVHESGEVVDMLVGEPPTVDAEALAACVASLHRAVILKRYPSGRPGGVVEHALGQAFERLGVEAKSKRVEGVTTKVRLGVRFKTPEEVGEACVAQGVTDVTDGSGCL